MSDASKVTPSHTHRAAVIYVRQSSSAQVEHNRESTERQYALVHRATAEGRIRKLLPVLLAARWSVATKCSILNLAALDTVIAETK